MNKEAKLYKCRGYLFCNYELLELSSVQIAKKCGVDSSTITYWLKKFNIKRRTRSENKIGEKNPNYGKRGKETSMYGRIGEKNPGWKGDNVTFGRLHKRVAKIKPKPEVCELCHKKVDKNGSIKLELSNIRNHNYTDNPDDYQYVHRSCHKKFDLYNYSKINRNFSIKRFKGKNLKCKECGENFTQNRANQKYCKIECYKDYHYRQQFGKDRPKLQINECKECGREFKQRVSRQVFCRQVCHSRFKNKKLKKLIKNDKKILSGIKLSS